ncbi:MAG: hypothetical protein Q9186_001357 [Xanthomendoza sp. 1 TL-2023]
MITRSSKRSLATWWEHKDFPFLSLPLELRVYIYLELLISDFKDSPDEPLLLWHDRTGRQQSLGIYPEILRTSKQINAEATPLLYKHNRFQLSLTSRERHSCRPQIIYPSQALIQSDSARLSRWFAQPGLISPLCLQRLAYIELLVSPEAVWANTMTGDIWSKSGGVFQDLLKILADADEIGESLKERKKFMMTVEKRRFNDLGWVMFPRGKCRNSSSHTKGEKRMVNEICPLVERIGSKRDVRIYEILEEAVRITGTTQLSSRTTTREVSLDDLGDL